MNQDALKFTQSFLKYGEQRKIIPKIDNRMKKYESKAQRRDVSPRALMDHYKNFVPEGMIRNKTERRS